jgi:nucleoside-diphosphate kinase
MFERTFVVIKPDAVRRGLVGAILSKFENTGLKIEAMKMLNASKELVDNHYPNSEDWLISVGMKTKKAYEEYNLDLLKDLGTTDALEIGRVIKGWLLEYITSGPVVALILIGNRAVEEVRKLVGNTSPIFADSASIRGSFSSDSPDLANKEKRPLYNLIHASGSVEEAEHEISLWFGG